MKQLVLVCSSALTLALGSGCSGDDDDGSDVDAGGEVDAGVEVDATENEFAAFDDAISTFLVDNGLEGASAVVVDEEEGEIHLAGYGAFDAGRLYLIASSSKILSAGVLLRLADHGLVDLDEPIGTYVAEAFGEGKPELTLAQLLSNSSGLVGLSDDPLYAPYICQYRSGGTLTDCARQIYVADDAADRVPPDTSFRYGGGQWQLAGGIAEVTSGKSWPELIAETYIEPCGADSLGYANQFETAGLGYPPGFDGDVANLTPTENPNMEGGAYVTVSDYGKLLLMHLRAGMCGESRALSQEAVERMRDDRIRQAYDGTTGYAGFLEGYGLGWWIDRENEGVFMDPGAYGAVPWLDLPRGYAAFIALEAEAIQGATLAAIAKPALDAIIDARRRREPGAE